MAAHLALTLTTLSTCWQIVRADGQQFYFTDHDQDIVFEDNTYRAQDGYARTAITAELGTAVDNLEVAGAFDDDAITESDIRAEKFDAARVYIFAVNWADPTMGAVKLRRGVFGEAELNKHGFFSTELRGMFQYFQQQIGEAYGDVCRTDLGSALCRVPILPPDVARLTAYAAINAHKEADYIRIRDPGDGFADEYHDRIFKCTTAGTTDSSPVAYDYTAGHSTTDGTAIFLCQQAWTRAGAVAAGTQTTADDHRSFNATVTEARAVDGWFDNGVITFESGLNAGVSRDIKTWVQTNGVVTTWLKFPFPIAAADKFYVSPGCDKTLKGVNGCKVKFANVTNRRAEDYVPGSDFLSRYPNAA